MQFPISIGLHRSRFLEGISLALACLLTVLCWHWLRSTGNFAEISVLCLGPAFLAWHWNRQRVSGVRLLRDGRLEICLAEGATFTAVTLLPGATVHPWLTALHLQDDDGRIHRLIVLPDSTDRQDFRRLRVFLRWQAARIKPGNDVA